MVFLNKVVFKLISKANFIIKLQLNFHYFIFRRYSKAFNLQVLYFIY